MNDADKLLKVLFIAAFFLTALIVTLLVTSFISSVVKKKQIKLQQAENQRKVENAHAIATAVAKAIVISTDYINIRDKFMENVFGTTKYVQSLNVSSTLVNNFSSIKQLDYLVKYFKMRIDENTLEYLIKLENTTKKMYDSADKNELPYKYFYKYIPRFVMKYTSAAGRSSYKSRVILDPETIAEFRTKIEELVNNQSTSNYQRRLMTPALRKQIMQRDNYTCQCCGNSIYNEPNLLLEVDHIVPVSRGGKTIPSNLQTLCWKCNRNKSDRL